MRIISPAVIVMYEGYVVFFFCGVCILLYKQHMNLLSVLACPYWRGKTIIVVRNPDGSIEWGGFL